MPKIKQSTVNVTKMFWLNGLEYQKGNWGVYYRDALIDPTTNQINENTLLVGIRELNSHSNILVTPVLISEWKDATDTPYSSLTSLLTDLSSLLGFSSGGATPQIQNVANYSSLPAPNLTNGAFYWVENSQGVKYVGALYGGTYYPLGLYYSNGVSWTFMETPFQATVSEVDAGVITDRFVTPATLSVSSWAFTTGKVLNTLLNGLSPSSGTFSSSDSVLTAFGKIKYLIDNIASIFVPQTRTLTIGGITQDLSTDRTFAGGANKRTVCFTYEFNGALNTATTNWWGATLNSAPSQLTSSATLTPTNNFSTAPVQAPAWVVPFNCRLKSITVKGFSNTGSGVIDLAFTSGTYLGVGSTLVNNTILFNQPFTIHNYLGVSNGADSLYIFDTDFTNYVIPKGYEIRMFMNNRNVGKNLLSTTIIIEFEEEI